MFICKIKDIKNFMSMLLTKQDFDRFAVLEASILTYCSFIIDGHLRKEHYSESEWRELCGERFLPWETLKPFCFQAVKGKKTPEVFKIVMLLSEKAKENFINENDTLKSAGYTIENINGLYMNFKYENGGLTLTTGTSVTFFTTDRTLDDLWAGYVRSFMMDKAIDFEEEI